MDFMLKLFLLSVLAFVFLFVTIMVAGVVKGTAAKRSEIQDDQKKEEVIHGKVVEKAVEGKNESFGVKVELTIEWIVFEKDDGKRIRLRNLSTNGILLAVGDKGCAVIRGETIYDFKRLGT